MFLIFDFALPDRDRRTETAPDHDRDGALGPDRDIPAGRAEADGGERLQPPEPGILHDDGIPVHPERHRRPDPVALADEIPARADEPELGLA